jgi:tryptophan halogenase
LTRRFPWVELYHIHDPDIPTLGVGEGTIPGFARWLEDVSGMDSEALQSRHNLTPKVGIQFENWGNQGGHYFHHFYPVRDCQAYHLCVGDIVKLLGQHTKAEVLPWNVKAIHRLPLGGCVESTDSQKLNVDFVIDARGFPTELGEDHIALEWVPTNAAMLRPIEGVGPTTIKVPLGSETREYFTATRAVARPHGWIFMIPLQTRLSCGYIHNSQLSSEAEVLADFDAFLEGEGLPKPQHRLLPFPNFTSKTIFDGVTLKIGNAASFVEPLEATALATAQAQINTFCGWPLSKIREGSLPFLWRKLLTEKNLEVWNRYFHDVTMKNSFFIAWHYSEGSRYDSPFWQHAKQVYREKTKPYHDTKYWKAHEAFIEKAGQLAHPTEAHEAFCNTMAQRGHFVDADVMGFFPQESFAEVGRGIHASGL